MVYWASITTLLGVIYALEGSLWEIIFGPGLQEHRIKDGTGHRIEQGIAKGYQLSTKTAIFVILLSATPILGVLYLEGRPLVALLIVTTVIMLIFWYERSPFMDPIYVEKSRQGDKILYEATEFKRHSGLMSTLFIGIVPAILIGLLLGWTLSRFAFTGGFAGGVCVTSQGSFVTQYQLPEHQFLFGEKNFIVPTGCDEYLANYPIIARKADGDDRRTHEIALLNEWLPLVDEEGDETGKHIRQDIDIERVFDIDDNNNPVFFQNDIGTKRDDIIFTFDENNKPVFAPLPNDVYLTYTNEAGFFSFKGLPEGMYRISVYFVGHAADREILQSFCVANGVDPDSSDCITILFYSGKLAEIEPTFVTYCRLGIWAPSIFSKDGEIFYLGNTLRIPTRVDLVQRAGVQTRKDEHPLLIPEFSCPYGILEVENE